MLLELPVHEGDKVKKGDSLAIIDDLIPKAQFDVAAAKLKAAKEEADSEINIAYAEAAPQNRRGRPPPGRRREQKGGRRRSAGRLSFTPAEGAEMKLAIEKAEKDHRVAGCQAEVSAGGIAGRQSQSEASPHRIGAGCRSSGSHETRGRVRSPWARR